MAHVVFAKNHLLELSHTFICALSLAVFVLEGQFILAIEVACKAKNTYYFVFYRKRMPTPDYTIIGGRGLALIHI